MTDYHQQALYFLANTGTEFEIEFSRVGKHFPDDKEDRDIYRFTLRNSKGEYSAEFGDSLHNTLRRRFAQGVTHHDRGFPAMHGKRLGFTLENGTISKAQLIAARIGPTAYDVLSCLQKSDPGTFADFVSDCGYDNLPLAEQLGIYHAVMGEYHALQRMFTEDELKYLQGIS